MKRIILVVLAVAIIAGGYYAYTQYQKRLEADKSSLNVETVVIEEGSLVSTIDATGKVRSSQTTTLLWKTTGTVEDVLVAVGDHVKAGDMLSTLSQTSLPQNIILAQADLVNAKKSLDDLSTNAEKNSTKAINDIATYAKQARDAQYQLDNYTIPSDQVEYSTMEALDLMKERLDAAREAFEPYKYYAAGNTTRQDRLEDLNQAQSDYNSAVKRLEYEYDLQVANDNLDTAREDFEKWQAGPDPDEVAAAEARIAASEATLSQAWIEAPFAGVITLVKSQLGDQVGPNSEAFRIDDLTTLFVDLSISEIDINQIEIGQEVTLTFDAIRGKEYHGEVVEIAQIGDNNQGVVNFTVTVEMTDPDEDVRTGMSASVEIVVSRRDKALLIPNAALRFEGGVQVVYVPNPSKVEGAEAYITVEVRLGNSSETLSEVLEGDLKAGDLVVLNPLALQGEPENPIFARMEENRESGEESGPFGNGGGHP